MRINDAPYDVTLTFLQTGVAVDVRKAREIVWSQGGFSDEEKAMRAYSVWRNRVDESEYIAARSA